MPKRDAAGEQGYRLGPGSSDIANAAAFEGSSFTPSKTLASPEAMSGRKLATAKGARRPPGSPRPGAFPSAIDQMGNPFAQQSNGSGTANAMNGTSPFPAFGQNNQLAADFGKPNSTSVFNFGGSAQNNTQNSLFSNNSSNTNQGGNTLTFNSLGQPHADQQPPPQAPNGNNGAFSFTFGTGGPGDTTKPSSTFKFGGSAGNNPFAGLSQQSGPSSAGLFASASKPVANSFPPTSFSGFGNANNNNNEQQRNAFGSSSHSFNNANTNGLNGSLGAFGNNFSKPNSTQQTNSNLPQSDTNGLFQQTQLQNNGQSQQQPTHNIFQQHTSQPSQPLFQPQEQRESNNMFDQNSQQDQNRKTDPSISATPSDQAMQTSPPNSPPKADGPQRSIFDVVANGNQSSEISSSNPFAFLSQHTTKSSSASLFASSQNQSSAPSQQSLPTFTGFGQNKSNAPATNNLAPFTPSQPDKPASTGFGQNPFQPLKSTSSEADTQGTDAVAQQSKAPASAFQSVASPSKGSALPSPLDKDSSSTAADQPFQSPKFDAPSFKNSPFANPFGTSTKSTTEQSSSPKFNTPSFSNGPFSNPFGNQLGGSAPSQTKATASSQSTSFPQPGASQRDTTASTPTFAQDSTTPSGSPSKPAKSTQQLPEFNFGTSKTSVDDASNATPKQDLFVPAKASAAASDKDRKRKNIFGQAQPLSKKQKQAHEAQRALLSLNHGFRRAVARMEPSEAHLDMMKAYISAADKLKKGYTTGEKRKQQDEATEPPKRIRAEESASTPTSQQKSTTANLFQSIISNDTTPSKPASELVFGQLKTPKRGSESGGLFQAAPVPATEPSNPNAGKSLFDRVSPAEKPATEVKKPAFSLFPSTSEPGAAGTGDQTWKNDSPIKFGISPPQQSSSQSLFPGSSLGLVPGSAATSRATTPGAGDGGTTSEAESTVSNTGDDDAEAPLDQVDLTGVDSNSAVIYEVEKARGSMQDLETKTWNNKGTGPLRILKDKESGVVSVLLRTMPSGRVVFNSRLVKGLPYKVAGKNSVTLPIVGADGKPQTWLLRFQSQDLAEEFAQECEKRKEAA